MGKTEGTCSKRRKKMVDETHDDGVLLAQKNVVVHSNTGARVTRSKTTKSRASSVIPINNDAATVHYQNQLVCAVAADADLKPVCITAAGIRKIKDTKGNGSNPPKLIAAKSFIQKNDACYPVRVKQQAEEFVDENISFGNQGACPSRNSNPSKMMSCRSLQKKAVDEFELHILRLAGEDDELQPRPLTVPSSTQLVENVLPCAIEETGVLKAHSFNLTEIAAMMDDHSSSHDEQEKSSIAPFFINVEGYNVKKEVAPMLQLIFDKHNDIARDCVIKNREIVVPILEVICSYCQKLENTRLKDTMDTEIEDMALVVENFQRMGFDVKWLIERLKDVFEMKRLMKGYPRLKEEKKKMEIKQKEVDVLKQKWSVAEAELATMKVDVDEKYHEFDRQIKALKVKGLPFWDRSLLYGLI